METVLMVSTVAAFALAIAMSAVAWRLLRENRQRSLARVEALQSMAASVEPPARHAALDVGEVEDENEEQRGDGEDGWDLPLAEPAPEPHASRTSAAMRRAAPIAARIQPRAAARARRLPPDAEVTFAASVQAGRGAPPGRWLAIAIVGLLMAAAVSSVYALYRPAIAAGSDTPVARAGTSKPLELLSLKHSVDSTGAFTVTGLVQNPADGLAARQIVAVVYLFDRDGNYFASGKTPLDFALLQPGDESPFVVHIPSVGRVSRYRVGFRTEEGGVVPHVDRRGQVPGGTTGHAVDTSTSPRGDAPRPEGRP